LLGKTGFGELGMIQSTAATWATLAGFGLGLTATKHLAEFRRADPKKAGRILTLSLVVAVTSGAICSSALFFLAPWLAERVLAASHLGALLRVSGGMLFFTSLAGAELGALSGFEAFRRIAAVNVVSGLLSLPTIVAGALFFGLPGAAWAGVLNAALSWGVTHIALLRTVSENGIAFDIRSFAQDRGVLWSFSAPAALGGILVGPISWACNALLVNQPNGYADLAIFNAAAQWRVAIMFLPTTFGASMLPVLASLYTKSDRRFPKMVLYQAGLAGVSAALVTVPIVFFAARIMSTYGSGFGGGSEILQILAVSACIVSVSNQLSRVIASMGSMWTGFWCEAAWGGACLLFGVPLTLKLGLLGLAVTQPLAALVQLFLQIRYLRGRLIARPGASSASLGCSESQVGAASTDLARGL
jgi:O-antigen/teichoic acid export membrane protein